MSGATVRPNEEVDVGQHNEGLMRPVMPNTQIGINLMMYPIPAPGSEHPFDWGWIVGMFEGEGSFVSAGRGGGLLCIFVTTDEDVIRHFHLIVGTGKVRGPLYHKRHPERKPYWRWECSGDSATRFTERILPYLGNRRRAKATELLEYRKMKLPTLLAARKCPQCGAEFCPIRSTVGAHRIIYCTENCGRAAFKRKTHEYYVKRRDKARTP